MYLSTKTKLAAVVLSSLALLSCKSEEHQTEATQQHPPAQQKQASPLELQIQLMLDGKPHDETILKAAIAKQEWKITFNTLKKEVEQYSQKHGNKPEKKFISRAYARLKKARSEYELDESVERKEQSLRDLEKTIEKAIEEERSKKQSN